MKILAVFFVAALSLSIAIGRAAGDDRPARESPQSASLEAARKAVEAKDFKTALGHLGKALQEAPNNADVHNLLGYSYRHEGRFDKSMEHYKTALKIDPNHRGAHEYIGELYLQMGQLPDAEKHLQALSKACPWIGRCEEHEDLKQAIEKHKAGAGKAR